MHSRLNRCTHFPSVRIALIACLTLPLSGWTTCTAIVNLNGCSSAVAQPQLTSLSPEAISADATSVVLTVNGTDLVPQSQILWNGNALPTTFVDSHQLQASITQQTFESFGGSVGTSVPISVISHASTSVVGCPNGGASGTLVLVIN